VNVEVSADDRAFLARFAACELNKEEFRHVDHVRLGWILLAEAPLLTALLRFRLLLKAFATHHGVPGLYNETITCFYMLLICECMGPMDSACTWERFKEMNPELFSYPKALLEKYYPDGSAFSAAAKASFILPETASAEAA
jgi:hypothetical protein